VLRPEIEHRGELVRAADAARLPIDEVHDG
jgi:hypothetical protein